MDERSKNRNDEVMLLDIEAIKKGGDKEELFILCHGFFSIINYNKRRIQAYKKAGEIIKSSPPYTK